MGVVGVLKRCTRHQRKGAFVVCMGDCNDACDLGLREKPCANHLDCLKSNALALNIAGQGNPQFRFAFILCNMHTDITDKRIPFAQSDAQLCSLTRAEQRHTLHMSEKTHSFRLVHRVPALKLGDFGIPAISTKRRNILFGEAAKG
jgi:hypothetical protein